MKSLLAVSLVAALFHYEIIKFDDLEVLLANPMVWLAASGLVALALIVGVFRWQLLLLGAGVKLPYLTLLKMYSIGAFMGTFLPGAVGQDAVRTVYLVRHRPQDKTSATLSVVADRAIGLFGFLGVSVVFIWMEREVMLASVVPKALAATVVLCFLGMLVGGLVFMVIAGALSRSRLLQKSESRWLIRQKLHLAFRIVVGFKGHERIVIVACLLSMVIPVLLAGCLVLFGSAQGTRALQPSELMLGGFIANIANTIPLTPGGVGIGEGAFDQICRLLEREPSGETYGSIFLAFRATTIIINLVFGASFLLYSRHRYSDAMKPNPSAVKAPDVE